MYCRAHAVSVHAVRPQTALAPVRMAVKKMGLWENDFLTSSKFQLCHLHRARYPENSESCLLVGQWVLSCVQRGGFVGEWGVQCGLRWG